MQTISEIRALLDQHGLRPRHALGQNFLHDKNQVRRLIDAADIASGDCVLEVGPGTGTLTEALIDAGANVVACELDRGLADLIEGRFGDSITLVRGDCLDGHRAVSQDILNAIDGRSFKLVANLPYQAASPLMMALLLDHPSCSAQFVTIQKEVADRLRAGPGSKTFGPLGIIAQVAADIDRLGVIPASCFWPVPKVVSAMVGIRRRDQPMVDDPPAFAKFITGLFSARRKQLRRHFPDDFNWPDGIKATMRPDALSVDQLATLFAASR